MTALRIALALAIVGVAIAACGEASTPTTTPTPTATSTSMLAPTPTLTLPPTLSATLTPTLAATLAPTQTPAPTLPAPAVPASAVPAPTLIPAPTLTPTSTPRAWVECADAPNRDSYDVAAVSTAPDTRWVYDIRVSGEDYHLTVNMIEPEGIVGEFIGIGGAYYGRTDGLEWEKLDMRFPLSRVYSPHPIKGEFVVCPNLDWPSLTLIGEETLNEQLVEHFRIEIMQHQVQVVDRTYDIWVDSSGQLVQAQQIMDFEATEFYPASRAVFRSTISGVGEPNVITAPALPTPSPAPTRTSTP